MTLKLRISIVTLVAILITSLVMLIAGERSERQIEHRFQEATITGEAVLWKKIIASQLQHMEASMMSLTRDRESLQALKAQDAEKLKTSLINTYNRLSTSHVISSMQVADVQGNILFSAPQTMTGKTNKKLVFSAIAERKIKSGIIRTDTGNLAVALVFPTYARGKLAGVGIYMRELQSALLDFKDNAESDAFVLNKDYALEYGTNPNIVTKLNLAQIAKHKTALTIHQLDDLYYSITKHPLTSKSGELLGYFISAHDYTKSYQQQLQIDFVKYIMLPIILLIIVAGLHFYLGRILKPLHTTTLMMQDIAKGDGDLTKRLQVVNNDEIGLLADSFNQFTDKIQKLITQITNLTKQLNKDAQSVSSVAKETHRGVLRQQSESDQVASATHEMSATVQQVAHTAETAAHEAENVQRQADAGKNVMTDAMHAMHDLSTEVQKSADAVKELEQGSQNIGSVLDVIRAIAEQTNLLALNAAIEAARAGEQGRGFAVVADEVRGLASRTQQSTQEIQNMIAKLQNGANDVVLIMEHGRKQNTITVDLLENASNAFASITNGINTMNNMNTQIASAANTQSEVARDINQNIENIAEVAITTEHGAKQSYVASDDLTHVVTQLQSLVNQFKV